LTCPVVLAPASSSKARPPQSRRPCQRHRPLLRRPRRSPTGRFRKMQIAIPNSTVILSSTPVCSYSCALRSAIPRSAIIVGGDGDGVARLDPARPAPPSHHCSSMPHLRGVVAMGRDSAPGRRRGANSQLVIVGCRAFCRRPAASAYQSRAKCFPPTRWRTIHRSASLTQDTLPKRNYFSQQPGPREVVAPSY